MERHLAEIVTVGHVATLQAVDAVSFPRFLLRSCHRLLSRFRLDFDDHLFPRRSMHLYFPMRHVCPPGFETLDRGRGAFPRPGERRSPTSYAECPSASQTADPTAGRLAACAASFPRDSRLTGAHRAAAVPRGRRGRG